MNYAYFSQTVNTKRKYNLLPQQAKLALLQRFADIANKYIDLRELTLEVLRTFIDRIVIYLRFQDSSYFCTILALKNVDFRSEFS